jgi:hypothetical protein
MSEGLGLEAAFAASIALPDLEDKSFDWLLQRKADLLGNSRSYAELSQQELMEFHAICLRLKHAGQTAGKPSTSRATRARSAKGPISADLIGDDFV